MSIENRLFSRRKRLAFQFQSLPPGRFQELACKKHLHLLAAVSWANKNSTQLMNAANGLAVEMVWPAAVLSSSFVRLEELDPDAVVRIPPEGTSLHRLAYHSVGRIPAFEVYGAFVSI